MKLILLLALIGAALAWQPSQYEYQYRGVIATGIPGIRPQVSGMGIRAKLVLQMKSRSHAMAKLEDIEVGEYQGDMKCVNLRSPMPLHFSPMHEYQSQLTKPFSVNFATEMGSVMEVPSADEEWIVNLRKSIVQTLRVQPLEHQFGEQAEQYNQQSVFSVEEETIFGRCESQYTITPLLERMKIKAEQEMKKQMEEDKQKSQIANEYYKMVRAIDFNKCHDRVMLQFTGVGNSSKAGQAQFEYVQSRSSVGTYLLKGTPKNFRVQKAVIEGDVIMHPFGIKTDKIQTITNQTLILKSVTPIKGSLVLPNPSRSVKTWRYEVTSPLSPPSGYQKPWMKYQSKSDKYSPMPAQLTLLGMVPSQQIQQEWKNRVQILLQHVAEQTQQVPQVPSTKPSPAQESTSLSAYKLYEASELLRALPLQQVRELFEQIFRESSNPTELRKQALLVDVAAASGASAPYKVLVEMMKSGKIHPARQISIFTTLTNNLANPTVIQDIWEYVKTLSIERRPILASTAYVNFAALLNRVCINHQTFNYTLPNPLFGRQTCKPKFAIGEVLPFFQNQLERVSESWEKGLFIQAIANMGTPHAIPMLHKVIMGKLDSNPRIRNLGIYGLSAERIPHQYREKVFDILMELVERISEPTEVREAAFVTLLTWQPDAAWFQRMARNTWREPSRQFAAFVTLTIENISKSTDPKLIQQANFASFVLPLTKPVTPEFRQSYIKLYSNYDPINRLTTNAGVAWLENMRSLIPSEGYAFLHNSVGGYHVSLAEVAVAAEGFQAPMEKLMKALEEASKERHQQNRVRTPENRREGSMWEEKEEFERYYNNMNATIYMKFFENMYQYVPLNKEIISKIAGPEGFALLKKLREGVKLNITKYINPMEIETFMPTELGLPLVAEVSMPSLAILEGEMKLFSHQQSQSAVSAAMAPRFQLLMKANTKMVTKLMVRQKVMVPWTQTSIESGIDNMKELNLPIYANLTKDFSQEIKNFTLNVAPAVDQRFPVFVAHNVPYTAKKSFTPGKQEQIQVITMQRNQRPLINEQIRSSSRMHGFQGEIQFISDAPLPYLPGKFMEYLRKPQSIPTLMTSPTAKLWQAAVILDPSQSTYRNVSATIALMMPEKSSVSEQDVKQILDLSPFDTPRERLQKIKEWSPAKSVKALNLQLVLNGTQEFNRFEAVFAWARMQDSSESEKRYKSQFSLLTTSSPRKQSPEALCVEFESQTPSISNIHELKERLQQEMKQRYEGKVAFGKTCASEKIASFKGSVDVTQERRRKVLNELESTCEYDEFNPVVEMKTAAVYDQGQFKLEYRSVPKQLVNATYRMDEVFKGLLFPFASFNSLDIQNPTNEVVLKLYRPMTTDRYTFWVQKPSENSIISEVYAPYWITRMVPFGGIRVPHESQGEVISVNERESETYRRNCTIGLNYVNTYDEKTFDYAPQKCYTMASLKNRHNDLFSVKTRHGHKYWIEIRLFQTNTNVTAAFDIAYLNGRVVTNKLEKSLVNIMKYNDHVQVTIFNDMYVRIYEHYIRIIPITTSIMGMLRGVCGDFDRDPSRDMTGPKGCLYTDAKLFQTSWTYTSGNNCDVEQLIKDKKKVEEFQQTCTKRMNVYNEHSYESSVNSNMIYAYPAYELREEKLACVAKSPVTYCKPGGVMTMKNIITVPFKCWKNGKEPKEVEENLGKYILHPESTPAPYSRGLKVTEALMCRY